MSWYHYFKCLQCMRADFNMEDEDEVDVLGDFSLDNLFSKEDGRLSSCYDGGVLGAQGPELLQCDYGITSQWLLDTSNQPCWYAATEDAKVLQTDDALASCSWDVGEIWTAKEKTLLEKGLALYGRSWARLSQFIGTKSSQQVKNYVRSHHSNVGVADVGCFSNEPNIFGFTELIDDIQIPASMEEVIAVVSTAQPTVSLVHRKEMAVPSASRESSVQSNATGKRQHAYSSDTLRLKGRKKKMQGTQKSHHISKGARKVIRRLGKKTDIKGVSKARRKDTYVDSSVLTKVDRIQLYDEEVVRIQKESSKDSDEDNEIEIEVSGAETASDKVQPNEIISEKHLELGNWESMDSDNDETLLRAKEEKGGAALPVQSHHEILESIFALPPPTQEAQLDTNSVTDEEKLIHAEFFEGRPAKTPKRYLKIRNHILECWLRSKPAYVTKTSVRTGLKNCGDVNCIGRIHAYLEQIGAINYGCEQARYTRPLYLMSNSVECEGVTGSAANHGKERPNKARIEAMRPRKRKLNSQEVWSLLAGEGGYTITHNENGEAMHTTVVVPDHQRAPGKVRGPKTGPIKLIYCSKYTDIKPAPFTVDLNIEPLLVMDFHAHSSHSEVIGLLGGMYSLETRVLHIKCAIPCRSISSGTHCDMCPVSQTEASELIHSKNFEVVGWYHSHPTFFPNPSLQDLDTQSNMQEWFQKTASAPLVGFILSPYCPTSKKPASEYRCMVVESSQDLGAAPYRLTVNIVQDNATARDLLVHLQDVCALNQENMGSVVDFCGELNNSPCLTYMEKCVASAKEHLDSCIPPLSAEEHSDILSCVAQACGDLLQMKQSQSKTE